MSEEALPVGGELEVLARLGALLGVAPMGETWIGDDAAVLQLDAGRVLFATDLVVDGVHFDTALSSLRDVGWKALVTNVSDVAAMGGRPIAAVVGVTGATAGELDSLYEGLAEASSTYSCPLVGGDLSAGPTLVVSVAILGTTKSREPVLRSGARPGDVLYVTAPLGRAAYGLRRLRIDPASPAELVDAHRRPQARVVEGIAAAKGGATAMIDLSDGLALDLDRLARASRVGFVLEAVPVAEGATRDEALFGGEDYELCFSTPDASALEESFAKRSLDAPIRIGMVVADASLRLLDGESLPVRGYEHRLG